MSLRAALLLALAVLVAWLCDPAYVRVVRRRLLAAVGKLKGKPPSEEPPDDTRKDAVLDIKNKW